ncbi:MAG: hypothetical protein ACLFU8_00810 [Anaerolineales bacterium]
MNRSPLQVFQVTGRSFKTLYEELFPLMLMSIVTWFATALVIPGPFSQAGLWYVARRALEGRTTSWQDFWDGVKGYGPRNWGNTLLVVGGYLLILVNLRFYTLSELSPVSEEVAGWLTALWIVIGILWSAFGFYLLAFQVEMVEPRFLLSLRNSLYLVLLRPLQTLILLALLGVIAFVCLRFVMLLPLIILYPALTALLSVNAVKSFVQPILESRAEKEADRDGSPE